MFSKIPCLTRCFSNILNKSSYISNNILFDCDSTTSLEFELDDGKKGETSEGRQIGIEGKKIHGSHGNRKEGEPRGWRDWKRGGAMRLGLEKRGSLRMSSWLEKRGSLSTAPPLEVSRTTHIVTVVVEFAFTIEIDGSELDIESFSSFRISFCFREKFGYPFQQTLLFVCCLQCRGLQPNPRNFISLLDSFRNILHHMSNRNGGNRNQRRTPAETTMWDELEVGSCYEELSEDEGKLTNHAVVRDIANKNWNQVEVRAVRIEGLRLNVTSKEMCDLGEKLISEDGKLVTIEWRKGPSGRQRHVLYKVLCGSLPEWTHGAIARASRGEYVKIDQVKIWNKSHRAVMSVDVFAQNKVTTEDLSDHVQKLEPRVKEEPREQSSRPKWFWVDGRWTRQDDQDFDADREEAPVPEEVEAESDTPNGGRADPPHISLRARFERCQLRGRDRPAPKLNARQPNGRQRNRQNGRRSRSRTPRQQVRVYEESEIIDEANIMIEEADEIEENSLLSRAMTGFASRPTTQNIIAEIKTKRENRKEDHEYNDLSVAQRRRVRRQETSRAMQAVRAGEQIDLHREIQNLLA